MWENTESSDTFIKLLYALADALKIYLTVSYDSPTTMRVSYSTRSAIKTNRVYLRDGASSKTIRKATNVDTSNQKQGGMAFYYADDGPITYTKSQKYDKSFMISTPSFVELRGKTKNESSTKRPILTISPTTALVEPGNDDDLDYVQAVIPHNHYFTFDGNPQTGYHYQETMSIHTAIYLYVKKHTIANGYAEDHPGSNREHDYYYTPAAAYSIIVDDVEKTFDRLTEYANSLLTRDGDYYQASKEIDVPYWNGFSLNSDGSASGWNKVVLRSEVIIDNISYLVRKITRSFSEIKTTLSLDAITRFDGVIDTITPIIPSIPEIPLSDTYIPDSTAVISDYTAHGSVKAYQYVSWYDVGKVVEFTYPKDSHYSRLAGFALNDADDGETVNVQTAGKLIIPGLSGPIGASLYLSDTTPNENVSQQWMIERTATANLWAEIARIIDNETIEVKLYDEYIFE
jgi:hypothetical protein